MATKKIQIEFDLNTNEVKLAGEATLSLAQQVRILQKELSKTPEGTKEFELLRRKLNDTKDNFDRVNAKSRELFGTLSLLPGPVGEIAGKLNGAISLMKTFSGFSFKDLKNQVVGLLDDFKGILMALGSWGDSTKKATDSSNNLTQANQQLSTSLQNTNNQALAAGAALVAANQSQVKSLENKIATEQSYQQILRMELDNLKQKTTQDGKIISLTKEQRAEKNKLNKELNNSIAYEKQYTRELKNTTGQQQQTTKTTDDLTKAQQAQNTAVNAGSKAWTLFKGALTAVGIGLLIAGVSKLVTILYDFVTGTGAAKKASEEFSSALQEENYWINKNSEDIKNSNEQRVLELKAQGASAAEIRKEETRQLEIDYLRQAELRDKAFKEEQAAVKGNNVDLMNAAIENYRKRDADFIKAETALKNKRLQNQIDENKEAETAQKDRDEKDKTRREKAAQDRQKELDELREYQRQADLTLMEAKDKEIAEVQDKYKKQIELAKKYRQDITDLVAAQAKEILEINKKYDEELRTKKIADYQALITIEENQADVDTERLIQLLGKRRDLELKEANLTREQKLAIQAQYEAEFRKLRQDAREKQLVEDIQASEGNFEKQIELYRQYADEIIESTTYTEAEKLRIIQETNDKILSLEQQRFDNEKTKLELKRQQDRLTNTEYYDELDALYVKELERTKQQYDQKIINEAEYNKRVKELSDARNNIRQAELEAEIATFQAIGQGLEAVSQLIGENTKQGKALAVAATLINTYAAIAGQLKAFAGVPIPGYAIAQAIATGLVGFAQVKKILSTQVPATTTSSGTMGGGAINVNQRRAQGGMIFGAGSDSSDSIPAMLSNGEFVVNARSTRVFRPLLESMNSAANLPQFAVGGLVSGPGMTPPQSQNETIADAISSAFGQTPIRTYVTANDVSTQQQFDRIIKSRSLI